MYIQQLVSYSVHIITIKLQYIITTSEIHQHHFNDVENMYE